MRTPQARALQRTLRSKFNTASPGESRNRLHDHGLHCRQSGRQSKILDCLDPASPTSLSSIRTLARGRAYAYVYFLLFYTYQRWFERKFCAGS
eukprot:scaffold113444_cov17-Tisochrysis_lutea.AAC.1